MTPRRLQEDRLPRVAGHHVEPMRAASLRLGGSPRQAAVEMGVLGRVVLRWIGFQAGLAPADQGPVFELVGPLGQGCLALDGWQSLRIVAATAGLPPPVLLRPLADVERGLLAAHVATFLRALRVPASVRIAAARWSPAPTSVTLALSLDVLGEPGPAFLSLSPRSLPAQSSTPPDRAKRLVTSGTVEIAATSLTVAEVGGLAPGDVVVFDDVPSPAPANARPGVLRVGSHRAAVELQHPGSIRIVSTFTEENPRMSDATITPRSDVPPTQVLGSAPVEVVAEVGRFTLRGDEVLGLAPGSVLPLPGAGVSDVELRVGGHVWARAELVEIEGRLGARVIELVR